MYGLTSSCFWFLTWEKQFCRSFKSNFTLLYLLELLPWPGFLKWINFIKWSPPSSTLLFVAIVTAAGRLVCKGAEFPQIDQYGCAECEWMSHLSQQILRVCSGVWCPVVADGPRVLGYEVEVVCRRERSSPQSWWNSTKRMLTAWLGSEKAIDEHRRSSAICSGFSDLSKAFWSSAISVLQFFQVTEERNGINFILGRQLRESRHVGSGYASYPRPVPREGLTAAEFTLQAVCHCASVCSHLCRMHSPPSPLYFYMNAVYVFIHLLNTYLYLYSPRLRYWFKKTPLLARELLLVSTLF